VCFPFVIGANVDDGVPAIAIDSLIAAARDLNSVLGADELDVRGVAIVNKTVTIAVT